MKKVKLYDNAEVVHKANEEAFGAVCDMYKLLGTIDLLIQSPATDGKHKFKLKDFQYTLVWYMDFFEKMKLKT